VTGDALNTVSKVKPAKTECHVCYVYKYVYTHINNQIKITHLGYNYIIETYLENFPNSDVNILEPISNILRHNADRGSTDFPQLIWYSSSRELHLTPANCFIRLHLKIMLNNKRAALLNVACHTNS
jgi:hypothetical protein